MERMAFALEMKALSDEGVLEGWASTYGNVDRMGDQVEAGAFTKSLKEKNNRVPLLADHDTRNRAGIALLEDRTKGLKLTGLLNLGVSAGKELYGELKFWAEHELSMGLSIGFRTVKDRWVNGVRHLVELELWEVSCVTFPANAQATVTAVKNDEAPDWAAVSTLAADIRGLVARHQASRDPDAAAWDHLAKEMKTWIAQHTAEPSIEDQMITCAAEMRQWLRHHR